MSRLSLPASISVLECYIGDDRQIDLTEASEVLSPDEVARAERFRFDRDRDRFVRARAFMRNNLASATGQLPEELSFTYGSHGKPFLVSSHVEFNLSHSQDIAVLAISPSGPVGVDVEVLDRAVAVADVAKVCMTASEQEVLLQLPTGKQRDRFFEFWTAKEARMKLTGEGMSLPPKSISLQLKDGRPAGFKRPELSGVQLSQIELSDENVKCYVCFGLL